MSVVFLPARAEAQTRDYYFTGQVSEVIGEERSELGNGDFSWRQNLRITVLDGPEEGQEIVFYGLNEPPAVKNNRYQSGDRVSIAAVFNESGQKKYFVQDYIRHYALLALAAVFAAVLFAISGLKGLRALISLILSFLIIVYYIIPQILSGASPVIVTLIGSMLILLAIIYLTEGFSRSSHIAVFSIFAGLFLTIIFSYFGIKVSHLTGLYSEEAFFLIEIAGSRINFAGLLLAGIIIGTLGVIDDIVISQIATVRQLSQANPGLGTKELFRRAQKVGVSHISSMINTLFLAYAGASLALLIFFVSGESVFSSWLDVVNNEAIATEIVRTLCGSIGLILVVPISTYLAAKLLAGK